MCLCTYKIKEAIFNSWRISYWSIINLAILIQSTYNSYWPKPTITKMVRLSAILVLLRLVNLLIYSLHLQILLMPVINKLIILLMIEESSTFGMDIWRPGVSKMLTRKVHFMTVHLPPIKQTAVIWSGAKAE